VTEKRPRGTHAAVQTISVPERSLNIIKIQNASIGPSAVSSKPKIKPSKVVPQVQRLSVTNVPPTKKTKPKPVV
jgi:hypothetical protein